MKYRSDIDGLRAVAVLSVVLFHANSGLLRGGFVGVDIFFVISGFLICRIIAQELYKESFSILSFYARRARRILPALTAVILFSVLVGWFLYLPADLNGLGEAVLASASFISNFYFMKEVQYFAAPLESYSLLHLWSLSVEEQFYIITPILMILTYKFRPNWLVGLLILCSLLSFVSSVLLVDLYPKGAFYTLPSRFWEMGLGAVFGLTTASPPRSFISHLASLVGGAFILASILFIQDGPPFPGFMALPPVVGTALIIWAGPKGFLNRLLSWRPIVLIGLISYSLYLWHWPILSFAKYYFIADLTALQTLAFIGLSVGAATLSYRFVEQPFRQGGTAHSVGAVLSGAGVTLAALSVTGVILFTQNGFSDRWDPAALSWLNTDGEVPPTILTGCVPISIAGLGDSETCVVGEKKAPYDFIVWGDSHAYAMQAGFVKLAQDTGLSGLVIAKFACTSLLGKRDRSMPFWLKCEDHNQAVLNFLSTEETKNIILVSRWTAVDNAQFFSGDAVGIPARILPLPDTSNQKGSIIRTVHALQGLDKSVFWLETAPGQAWDVPRTFAKAAQWQTSTPPLRTRAEYESAHAHINQIFNEAGGAIVIPSSDALCDFSVCFAELDRTPLYFDDDHVSPLGAMLLSNGISQALSKFGAP